MERVKEESRRKSEELEMLKRSVEERNRLDNSMSSSVPLPYSQDTVHPMKQEPTNDYIMDFSKPAGYKPAPESPSQREDSPAILRRRSLEPMSIYEMEKPPLPSNPPPRRSLSRETTPPVPPPVPPSVPLSTVQRRPSRVENTMEKQHNQLMEEIRKSVSQRKMKGNEEYDLNECVD